MRHLRSYSCVDSFDAYAIKAWLCLVDLHMVKDWWRAMAIINENGGGVRKGIVSLLMLVS